MCRRRALQCDDTFGAIAAELDHASVYRLGAADDVEMRGVLRRAAFNAAPVVGMAVVDAEGRFTQAVGRIAKVAVPAPDPVAGTISIGIITADGLIPV